MTISAVIGDFLRRYAEGAPEPPSTLKPARPSSPFPFSPFTDDVVSLRLDAEHAVLALMVMLPRRGEVQDRCFADEVQRVADLTRSMDVRVGFVRAEWAGLGV